MKHLTANPIFERAAKSRFSPGKPGEEKTPPGRAGHKKIRFQFFCSLAQVKKALCVLIQHSLVHYEAQPRGFVEYEARSRRILRILRYPRYIYTAKTLYGDPGELLVEELLLHGHLPMSSAVARVADRLTETMEGGEGSFSLKIIFKKNGIWRLV